MVCGVWCVVCVCVCVCVCVFHTVQNFYLQDMMMISGSSLRDRVVRPRSEHCCVPIVSQCYAKEIRPDKYKTWSDDVMQKALESVRLEGRSVRRAALEYGVPRSTLADRVSGRVSHGVLSGPPRYLNDEEEEELVSFFWGALQWGMQNPGRRS